MQVDSQREAVPGMNRQDIEALLLSTHAACHGWAMNCCGWNREEALDVLQTSYLKMLDGRVRFEGRSQFRTWAFGVIRITALERRRRDRLRLSRLTAWMQRESPRDATSPDASTAAQLSDDSRRLRQALDMLPERQREVIHLVFYQELSVDEAAEAMGVSAGTARTHYDRAKAALRRVLGPAHREGIA